MGLAVKIKLRAKFSQSNLVDPAESPEKFVY